MGNFCGKNVPSSPRNALFPITHLYHSIIHCISYYPYHVQSGGKGKSMVNEICGSKPLGRIDMRKLSYGLLRYGFDFCFAKMYIMLELVSLDGISIS